VHTTRCISASYQGRYESLSHFLDASSPFTFSLSLSHFFSFFFFYSVPKVCDACKEKSENDNEIVDSLCKNDFGKDTICFMFAFSRLSE